MRSSAGTVLALVAALGVAGPPRVAWGGPEVDEDAPAEEPSQDGPGNGEPGDGANDDAAETDAPAPASPTEPDPPGDEPFPAGARLEARIREAERHFVEGMALQRQGRYVEAAAEFERSYAAIPVGDTLYNIGSAYEAAARPVEAIHAARRYLALPDCKPGESAKTSNCADERAARETLVGRLLDLVGELQLVVPDSVSLREVRVDDRQIPLGDFPLLLEPGTYEVELFGAKRDQHRTHVVEIEAGAPLRLFVPPFDEPRRLPPDVRGGDPIRDAEAEAARRARQARITRGLKISFWTGLGLTGASAAALGTFGGLGLHHSRRYDSLRCDNVPGSQQCDGDDPDYQPPPTGEDPAWVTHREAAERYQRLTNIMIGVTAGVAAATALVGIFAFTRDRAPEGSRRWSVGPGLVRMHW